MTIELVTTAHGPEALAALRRVVDRVQPDRFDPVTVIVPTNYVGVSARRALASGRYPAPSGRVGLVNVTFQTLYRTAEQLGGATLTRAGRRPVSTPVLTAAVRTVLRSDAGLFESVAEHPATERALVSAHRELRELDDRGLAALASASERADHLVRIHRHVHRQLAPGWFDEHDLLGAAIAELGAGAEAADVLGAVVVFLPQRMSRSAAALVAAIAGATATTVVAARTGHTRADATVAGTLARLGLTLEPDSPAADPAVGTVVSLSDPDEEVRAAVRAVVDAARAGVRLDRMAILFGHHEPYARLLHEQLGAAGIAFNGTAVRTPAESLLGHSLLALLALPDRGFRRSDVLAVLATGPVRWRGRTVPSAAWERLSREAGVVRGVEEWTERLDQLIEDRMLQIADLESDEEHDWRIERAEREIEYARSLREFVTGLAEQLDPGRLPSTWYGRCAWARRLIATYLGGGKVRADWPQAEVAAAQRVEAALDRLEGLDAVEPAPSGAAFRRTLEAELDTSLGRIGRLGQGLLIGHISAGLGLDLDRVVVVGAAEGTLPARVRDDSLLPDRERIRTGELPLRSDRCDDDHRLFLAALASATDRNLTYPRGDLRRSAERMPSRWLTRDAHLHEVPSFVSAIARLDFAATEQEHALRSLLAHDSGGQRLDDHPLATADPAIGRGVALIRARSSEAFTRYDGNLGHLGVPSPADADQVVSPTRLETWAACPHRYLFRHLLKVEPISEPDRLHSISPLDRGNVIHHALDRFLAEVLARPPAEQPLPDEPWPASDRTRLRRLGLEECQRYEARGLVGKQLFWRRERRRILSDLDGFLDADDRTRREHRLLPYAAELGFGVPGAPLDAIEIPLSDGRTLRVRGSADRVDTVDGGDAIAIVDYKTGKADRYTSLSEQEPHLRGTKLQLPVYAHAARVALDRPDAPVEAAYWFVTGKAGYKRVGYHLTEEVSARFDEALRVIVDGISGGLFPSRPIESTRLHYVDCEYCDPDGMGVRDRRREWERKRSVPELAAYLALAEPEALG